MVKKEIIYKLVYFLLSHVCLILIFIAVRLIKEKLQRIAECIHYFIYYQVYYLNDPNYFLLSHPLAKQPSHLVIHLQSKLSSIEIQSFYDWCCIIGIAKVTFISLTIPTLTYPLTTLKPPVLSILPFDHGFSQILQFCKEDKKLTKQDLIDNNADVILSFGRKGMKMEGIAVNFLYSAEIYHLKSNNLLSFYQVLKRYSESEQRCGK